MYKIFINEYPLVISADEQDFFRGGNFRMVDDSKEGMIGAIETLERSDKIIGNFGLMIMTEDADATFSRFSKLFQPVAAAGGLIFNEKEEILLILRQGKWDLPKGKVDKGETVEEAAVREVQEECGIEKVELLEPLFRMYHTYYLDQKRVLKTTHWFKMRATQYAGMLPQLEENITELRWFNPKTLNIEGLDTYNSIRELLIKALR